MTSEKAKDISKYSLEETHQQQLRNGFQNDTNKDEIVQILGGIDHILTKLLNSDSNINQQQINQIHRVITNPKKLQSSITSNTDPIKVEDKKFDQNITYKFYDDDTILMALFGSQRTKKILNIMTNNITIAVLFLTAVIWGILAVLAGYGLPMEIYYPFASYLNLALFVYVMVWILYCNKKGMQLLCQEFEFYFKLWYLLQFLMAYIGIGYFDNNRPMYYYCTTSLCLAAFSFLVMIFDAMNIKKEKKLISSSVAAAYFAFMALQYSRMANFPEYQNDLYQRAKITISHGLRFSDLEISLIDTAANSAKILTIFMFKQFVSSIIRPNQSLIIKKKPWMEYENSTVSSKQKHVKLWRIACISWWSLALLFIIVDIFRSASNMDTVKFIFDIGRFVLSMIGFCCFISNNIKCIMMAIIIVFVWCIMYGADILFMNGDPLHMMGILFLLGMVCGYLLKVREFREYELEIMSDVSPWMNTAEEVKRNDVFVDDIKHFDDEKTEKEKISEIRRDKIMDGNKNAILFNNEDSKTFDNDDRFDEIIEILDDNEYNDIDDSIKTVSSHIEMNNVHQIDTAK